MVLQVAKLEWAVGCQSRLASRYTMVERRDDATTQEASGTCGAGAPWWGISLFKPVASKCTTQDTLATVSNGEAEQSSLSEHASPGHAVAVEESRKQNAPFYI